MSQSYEAIEFYEYEPSEFFIFASFLTVLAFIFYLTCTCMNKLSKFSSGGGEKEKLRNFQKLILKFSRKFRTKFFSRRIKRKFRDNRSESTKIKRSTTLWTYNTTPKIRLVVSRSSEAITKIVKQKFIHSSSSW